jgi:hypothetical protein
MDNLPDGLYLKARICEEDLKGSFAIDADTAVAVVEDCLVRIDAVGVPGAYAVRLRNENDDNWSDWIQVADKRPDLIAGNDDTSSDEGGLINAWFVDENRFLVPWFLSAGNGPKHVSLQVLTFYGISPVFSLDVVAQIAEMEYSVRFYKKFDNNVFSDEFPTYLGYPVVTQNVVSTADNPTESQIYLKVEFSDKERLSSYLQKISKMKRFKGLTAPGGGLSFNVIQQGENDLYYLPLTEVTNGIYKGEWEVLKSDGTLNKDGLSAIVVNVPSPCSFSFLPAACGEDLSDPQNPLLVDVLRDFYTKYDKSFEAVDATSVGNLRLSSGQAKGQRLRAWKQMYTKDDGNFVFGNPKFFFR